VGLFCRLFSTWVGAFMRPVPLSSLPFLQIDKWATSLSRRSMDPFPSTFSDCNFGSLSFYGGFSPRPFSLFLLSLFSPFISKSSHNQDGEGFSPPISGLHSPLPVRLLVPSLFFGRTFSPQCPHGPPFCFLLRFLFLVDCDPQRCRGGNPPPRRGALSRYSSLGPA